MLFADFLNYAMEQANITNYKLAKHLNISQTTVANWLEGKTEPREKKRAEVLWLFGVSEKDIETGCPKILYRGESDQKEKPTLQTESELDAETIELRGIWDSADEDERRALLEMARLIKSRRNK